MISWIDIGISIGCVVVVCLLYYYFIYLPAKRLAAFLAMGPQEQASYLTGVSQSVANDLVLSLPILQLSQLYTMAISVPAQAVVVNSALAALPVEVQTKLYNAITGYTVPGLLVYSNLQSGKPSNALCPSGLVVSSVQSAHYGADNQGGVPPIGSCAPLDVSQNPAILGLINTNEPVNYADTSAVFTDPCPKYTKSLIANYTCGIPMSTTINAMGPKVGANAVTTK
jgi:hypothetical protein